MEELTEVITAAEFHPVSCNLFCYSSSKGTVKLADMREQALCDKHAKRECPIQDSEPILVLKTSVALLSLRRGRGSIKQVFLLRDHLFRLRCQILQGRSIHLVAGLPDIANLGHQYGEQTCQDDQCARPSSEQVVRLVRERLHL